jgi:hypothetical protein
MAKKKVTQSAYKDITHADHDEVVEEKQVRRSGAFNGGGPWTKEQLLARHSTKKLDRK